MPLVTGGLFSLGLCLTFDPFPDSSELVRSPLSSGTTDMFTYSLRTGQTSSTKSEKFLCSPNHHGLAGLLETVLSRRKRKER